MANIITTQTSFPSSFAICQSSHEISRLGLCNRINEYTESATHFDDNNVPQRFIGTKLTTAIVAFYPSGTQDNHLRNKNTQPEAQQEHWSAQLCHRKRP